MRNVVVLIPVRNGADRLGAALRSVLAQTGVEFRVVVVDDGSTDATPGMLDAIRDPRLTTLTRPPRGIIGALNDGLAHISEPATLIARMDADDVMVEGRLAAQARFLSENRDISVVGSRVVLDPADSPMARYVNWLNTIQSPSDVAREIFVESPLCHPSTMIRADALRAVGGYRDLGWPEDYDLWLRLHIAGHKMAVLDTAFHVWTDHSDRLTRQDPRYDVRRFCDLRARFLVKKFGADLRIWGAGRDGRRLAAALEREGATLHQFVDIDPRKIGGVRRGNVPVVGPDGIGPPDPTRVLVSAVGVPAARAGIRQKLTQCGYEEGRDFVCAA